MGQKIYNPAQATIDKHSPGFSDTLFIDSVMKFMGASVLSISTTVGWNGIPSSASISLVVDTENNDNFIEPTIPSLWGFSLPLGGPGQPIIYTDQNPIDLNPNNFNPTNTPFYFTGICTSWHETQVDIGGRTIQVSLVDPREVLSGVQCLLNGFALSENIGAGNRYTGVQNVMDIFGYWNYGMESGANQYGMPWNNILTAISDLSVIIDGMTFEFVFTGECFTSTPTWYRIDNEMMDLMSLVNLVTRDGGSDLVVVGRKTGPTSCLVEFRGIRRRNADILTQSEIDTFINARPGMINSAKVGKEYKNEPTSSIIVGGFQNSNYTAFPSEYVEEMHLTVQNIPDQNNNPQNFLLEDYGAFPADIKVRLFGGTASVTVNDSDGTSEQVQTQFNVKSGAIFPFWGLTPDDYASPLIEPFLSLDHLVFDKFSDGNGFLRGRIPLCLLKTKTFTVRQVPHDTVFLSYDNESDNRPFSYLDQYIFQSAPRDGWIRGLPLNTEVLRAALVSEQAFWNLYSIYYPDIAVQLDCPGLDFSAMLSWSNLGLDMTDFHIENHMLSFPSLQAARANLQGVVNANGAALSTNWFTCNQLEKTQVVLQTLRTIIYEQVKQYASQHMGKMFIVCLPASNIMQRIWMGLPVPTNPLKPDIEYKVEQNGGYWEVVPPELSNIIDQQAVNTTFTMSETNQIRRRFMQDDGRFTAMVGRDFGPTGNINFNSNGTNKALFQDLSPHNFRPSRIASRIPEYVLTSCQVTQLIKRPDLALVEVEPIMFDPDIGSTTMFSRINVATPMLSFMQKLGQEFLSKKSGWMKFFWHHYYLNSDFRTAIKICANRLGLNVFAYANITFVIWANRAEVSFSQQFLMNMSTEMVMDLKGVIIPLTSTWMTYGPWFATFGQTQGMVNVVVDSSLVPWNFTRPDPSQAWDLNLNAAGVERLQRSISDLEYIDSASISVVGYPEFGPADQFGYNSNITSISCDFSIGGVKTVYSLATYGAKPGTFRKSEYDDLTKGRFDPRAQLPDPNNYNIARIVMPNGDVYGADKKAVMFD